MQIELAYKTTTVGWNVPMVWAVHAEFTVAEATLLRDLAAFNISIPEYLYPTCGDKERRDELAVFLDTLYRELGKHLDP